MHPDHEQIRKEFDAIAYMCEMALELKKANIALDTTYMLGDQVSQLRINADQARYAAAVQAFRESSYVRRLISDYVAAKIQLYLDKKKDETKKAKAKKRWWNVFGS